MCMNHIIGCLTKLFKNNWKKWGAPRRLAGKGAVVPNYREFLIVLKEGLKWEDEKTILQFNFYVFTHFMLQISGL